MSKSQVLEKTIATLEKEVKTLKELQSTLAKKPETPQKDTLKGILKGANITDGEIEAAKKELNF